MAAPSSLSPPPDPLVPADLGGWFAKVAATIRRSFTRLLIIQVGLSVVSAVVFAIFGAFGASQTWNPSAPLDVTTETFILISWLSSLFFSSLPLRRPHRFSSRPWMLLASHMISVPHSDSR